MIEHLLSQDNQIVIHLRKDCVKLEITRQLDKTSSNPRKRHIDE